MPQNELIVSFQGQVSFSTGIFAENVISCLFLQELSEHISIHKTWVLAH